MTNPNLTEIVCVVDRSSSMEHTTQEVIDGFNIFLKDQKALPGEGRITLALFDTRYELLLNGVLLREVKENFLSRENYVAHGATALLDSVGKTIDAVGERLMGLPEEKRPGKVIFLIMTDGEENSSQTYVGQKVPDMIKHQREKYNWEFVFIGANVNSFHLAQNYNIGYSANYVQTKGGTQGAFARLSMSVGTYRSTGIVDTDDLDGDAVDSDSNN